MRHWSCGLVGLVLVGWLAALPAVGRAVEEGAMAELCARSAWANGTGERPQRHYAPDRRIDIRHLKLDVTPDFEGRRIEAKCRIRFEPIAKPVREIRLDAVGLDVDEVTSSREIEAYQVTKEAIVITLKKPLSPGEGAHVRIRYGAKPKEGLYFRTPAMGYREGDTHLFTQGEPHSHRHWFPSHDYPNERFTSEVICRVPEGMVALSNGRLVSKEKGKGSGRTVFHWKQEKPHVGYMISLVAGYFKKLEKQYKDIPLAFYTPPSEFEQAPNSFRDTKKILAFFEEEIGVPYPWAKYYNVCVQDFMYGGMENTSITTLTTRTLFTDAVGELRSSHRLDAHEVAHQWFGDLVTCKDWSHLWLNEGFATYYSALYEAHKNGRDAKRYQMYQYARRVLGAKNDLPMVYREYDEPEEQFDYRAYPKGAWVLHMIRSRLGPELFRRFVRTYLERHRFESVVTEDLNAILEEVSGRNWDRFFDQWVYHAGHPELEVSYSWDEKHGLAHLSVRQTQEIDDSTMLFHFPLRFRFKHGDKSVVRTVEVDEKQEDFYFKLAKAPEIVRVNPDSHLLAQIDFNPPMPLVKAQLRDADDMIGRLRAVEALQERKPADTVELLKQTLNGDAFWAVRAEAAKALGAIHSEEALAALIDSNSQDDARVRREVVDAIGAFYREKALKQLRTTVGMETNPIIQAEAIEALAPYPRESVRSVLVDYLDTASYRNRLAEASVEAMRHQADPYFVAPLRQALKARESEFTTSGLGDALQALAFLAKEGENKRALRRFIAQYVNNPRDQVSEAAIGALGTLGDRRAIPLLETFLNAEEGSPRRKAAEKAIESIRERQPAYSNLRELRERVLELQQEMDAVNGEVRRLKKKLDRLK